MLIGLDKALIEHRKIRNHLLLTASEAGSNKKKKKLKSVIAHCMLSTE